MSVRRRVAAAGAAIIAGGVLGAPAAADAAPLCRLSVTGPIEYQRTLGPLVSGFVLAPPAPGSPTPPPPPPASTGIGAARLAREALGPQFSGVWLSNAVQGWVVGLAPGPLDSAAARASIVERIAAHYTPSETAYLSERLHVDPQLYSEDELRATQDALSAVLRAEPNAPYWGMGIGCSLSDARRVEVTVNSPATPEQFARVVALGEAHGDRVRVELSPHGPPTPGVLPGRPPAPPAEPVAVARHVTVPILRRCVRGRAVRIAARSGQPSVQTLTLAVGRSSRTIAGRRLAKPLVVALRGRRTKVTVTVRLSDGRVGTRTVTYTRCR